MQRMLVYALTHIIQLDFGEASTTSRMRRLEFTSPRSAAAAAPSSAAQPAVAPSAAPSAAPHTSIATPYSTPSQSLLLRCLELDDARELAITEAAALKERVASLTQQLRDSEQRRPRRPRPTHAEADDATTETDAVEEASSTASEDDDDDGGWERAAALMSQADILRQELEAQHAEALAAREESEALQERLRERASAAARQASTSGEELIGLKAETERLAVALEAETRQHTEELRAAHEAAAARAQAAA